jgi:tetratricopeptide (TPR) repeat protein
MAKKKRTPGGRQSNRRPDPPGGEPDPRAAERLLRRAIDGLGGVAPDAALARAQDLADRAFGERDERRRVRLAEDALRLSPDCADAHVVLADAAPTRRQALEHYRHGVAAGERALGPDAFRDHAGHFWGLLASRPYMRARLGLAHALWVAGGRDEAVGHLRDMLRLNPNDNQGVRYTLAGFLLFLDRDDDLAELLGQYPDEGSATWAYTRALLAFRRQGDTPESRRLLKAATRANRYVPAYLTGAEFPPPGQPDYYTPGDESEAVEYVSGFLAGWKSTPGAVGWVRASTAKPAGRPRGKGPSSPAKRRLAKDLPQEYDVWQADARPLPGWVRVGGAPVRPWAVLVASRSNDLVLAHQVTDEPPPPALVWDTLAQAMRDPAAGEPHRPTTIQVRPGESWEALRPHVEDVGVGLEAVEELDVLDAAFASLAEHVGGPPAPGRFEVPGVTPERVAGFFAAAATFFRQAPWKRVGYEAAIAVECGQFQSGPWYAVLMGQSGLTAGLALYEDLEVLRRLWAGDEGDEENARRTVATSVTFGEAWEIPVGDLDAAETYGWEVAQPDAYPQIFHKDLGLSMRPPLAWELELVEACLRAVPEFVRRRPQDDLAREEFVVPAGLGELKLALSWVPESGDV